MYCGATQIPGILARRIVVVSGGASWADILAPPKALAAMVQESVASKRRRVCADCIVPPIALRSSSCFRPQNSTARMLRCGTILKKGVDTWNAWRRENPDIRPDLSGAGSARAQLG